MKWGESPSARPWKWVHYSPLKSNMQNSSLPLKSHIIAIMARRGWKVTEANCHYNQFPVFLGKCNLTRERYEKAIGHLLTPLFYKNLWVGLNLFLEEKWFDIFLWEGKKRKPNQNHKSSHISCWKLPDSWWCLYLLNADKSQENSRPRIRLVIYPIVSFCFIIKGWPKAKSPHKIALINSLYFVFIVWMRWCL